MKNFHINPSLQVVAVELVKKEILKRQSTKLSCTTTTTTPVNTNALDSQTTTSKCLLSYCFDTPQNHLKSISTPYDELNEYLELNVQLNEKDDILQFWLQQKLKFPILFSIVQDLYAVPASNTTVERLFSSSKTTVTDKRTRLDAEKINKLLFLQKNLVLLKSFDENQINEVHTIETKRRIGGQLSSTISCRNEEEPVTTTTKKFKVDDEDDIVFCNDDCEEDKENDETDFF